MVISEHADFDEHPLLWLTQVGTNVDSKVLQRQGFLKDFFKDKGICRTSAIILGSNGYLGSSLSKETRIMHLKVVQRL